MSYQCMVPGCPGEHASKWQVCAALDAGRVNAPSGTTSEPVATEPQGSAGESPAPIHRSSNELVKRLRGERVCNTLGHKMLMHEAADEIERLMKLLEIERGVVLTRGQALTRALRCFDELLDNVWPNGLPSTVDAVVEQMRRALENGKRPPSETTARPIVDLDAEQAFEAGWRAATSWTDRDDLFSDIGSSAYHAAMTEEFERMLARKPERHALKAPETTVHLPGDGTRRAAFNEWWQMMWKDNDPRSSPGFDEQMRSWSLDAWQAGAAHERDRIAAMRSAVKAGEKP